jgi:hypothetical protein
MKKENDILLSLGIVSSFMTAVVASFFLHPALLFSILPDALFSHWILLVFWQALSMVILSGFLGAFCELVTEEEYIVTRGSYWINLKSFWMVYIGVNIGAEIFKFFLFILFPRFSPISMAFIDPLVTLVTAYVIFQRKYESASRTISFSSR